MVGTASISVNVFGEVRAPGTFTLPSVSKVFNALYSSGGPNRNGSFRNIEVIRNNEVVARLDVYDFLISGITEGNIQLENQDLIRVPAYDTRVELLGAVRREGYYELRSDENINRLLEYAGGFGDQAYSDLIKVDRVNGVNRSFRDVPKQDFEKFFFEDGDKVSVEEVVDLYENRVEIQGAVFREGYYQLTPELTVNELIAKAQGFRPDALQNRIQLFRENEDLSLKVLSIDMTKDQNGIKMQQNDRIVVYSKLDLKEEFTVTVDGEVNLPGEYPYSADMTVEDLVLLAEGFKESSELSNIEIVRRITRGNGAVNGEVAEIFSYKINDDFSLSNVNLDFKLMPFDQVEVRSRIGYREQQYVSISGEISYPGQYGFQKREERLSDIIKRAGGLTEFAYEPGASLVRTIEEGIATQAAKQQLAEDSLLEESDVRTGEINIEVDLMKALANPGSKDDIILVPGDKINVPQQLQTVTLSGEFLYPAAAQYTEHRSFKYYLSKAGGFSDNAKKGKVFVIYPNGSVDRTKQFLFFRNYPDIKPGSEIVAPGRPERRGISTGEIIGITSGLSSIAAIIAAIILNNN